MILYAMASLVVIRAPGTGWPGVIAYGVRRMTGERPDFSAVLRRRPTALVELDPPRPRFGEAGLVFIAVCARGSR